MGQNFNEPIIFLSQKCPNIVFCAFKTPLPNINLN